MHDTELAGGADIHSPVSAVPVENCCSQCISDRMRRL